jgi:hypothetical protein
MTNQSLKFLGLFGFLFTSIAAWARPYNFEDVPIGERAFGMGGASVAVEGDVGNMFTNPATLASITSSQVSASLSAYARVDTRTGEYVSLFKSSLDNISRGGFMSMPSMVGGHVKAGPYQWGGAILVPFLFENSGTVNLNSSDLSSFESKFESVWMGAFISRQMGPWGMGLSIFYGSREFDEKFFFVTQSVSPSVIRFIENQSSVNGFVFVFGGTYQISDDLKVGLSLRPPAWGLGGTGSASDVQSGSTNDAQKQSFTATNFYPLPPKIAMGASYQVNSRLLIATDVNVYLPQKGNQSPTASGAFAYDSKAIANALFGFEWQTWEHMGIRMGYYTNLSAARSVSTVLSAINDKVHMFGGTAALIFRKDTGTISIGGYVQGGQGSSTSLTQTPTKVPRSNYVYGFVVGSNYKF